MAHFFCNIRPTKVLVFCTYWVRKTDVTGLSPRRFSQPALLTAACSPQRARLRCVSMDQISGARTKTLQTMQWVQLCVSAGFNVVILHYVTLFLCVACDSSSSSSPSFFLLHTPPHSPHKGNMYPLSSRTMCDSLQWGNVIAALTHACTKSDSLQCPLLASSSNRNWGSIKREFNLFGIN